MEEKQNGFQTFLRDNDNYALPVGLTYNNKKSHATAQGGFCSIISLILIGWYIGSHLIEVISPKF